MFSFLVPLTHYPLFIWSNIWNITILTLANTVSGGNVDGGYGERCEFVGVLCFCTCVRKCMCMLMCVCIRAGHVCVDHGGIP